MQNWRDKLFFNLDLIQLFIYSHQWSKKPINEDYYATN